MNSAVIQPFVHKAPTNEAEFREYMEAMDRHFSRQRMPLPSRQLAAIAEACRTIGRIVPVPRDRPPQPGSYDGEDLLLQVIAWYEERYGDALKVYFGPGHGLVIIRGARWVVRYPTITGRAGFVAGSGENSPRVVSEVTGEHRIEADAERAWADTGLRKFDVLEYIEGLPPGLRSALHHHELRGILYAFCRNRLFLHALIMARHYEFVEEARADFEAAIQHVTAKPPATGQAKWACLQGVEKTIKSFLLQAGVDFPRRTSQGHDLHVLADLLANAGGPTLPKNLIDEVQCSASVRYESELVTGEEAARAHFAGLELAGVTAAALLQRFPKPKA